MKVKWWQLSIPLLLFVSLSHARDTKNLDLKNIDTSDLLSGHDSDGNYDVREDCNGPNMEWLTNGPACDVYCDNQPAIQKPSSLSSLLGHKSKRGLRLGSSLLNRRCQSRMDDVIHDIINDAELEPNKIFINGNLDLDNIAVNVTNTMRNWVSDRYQTSSQVYEGCYCKAGFARYGGNCVALRDCPNNNYPAPSDCKAGNNEVWKDDGPECDVYCQTQPRGRSFLSNRNQCDGDFLRTLQEFEPSVKDLESKDAVEALTKHGEAVTNKLRSSFSSLINKNTYNGVTTYSGCYCVAGYLRYGDVCLLPQNCPTSNGPVGNPNLCNGANEEYRGTSDQCEVYCDIQPTKYGRWGSSLNSCGRTGDFLRNFLPTLDEYKNDFDRPKMLEKYAENITESLRLGNKNNAADDGCYCKPGYARYGYRCVSLSQCPTRRCQKYEVYQTQGPVCEPTCTNLQYQQNGVVSCGNCQTMSGCFCPTGQVRDDRGKCIDPVNCWNYNNIQSSSTGQVVYNYVRGGVGAEENIPVEVIVSADDGPAGRVFLGDEKPIYNRKILTHVEETEEKPVVDGFKKEMVEKIEDPIVSVTEGEPIYVPVVADVQENV